MNAVGIIQARMASSRLPGKLNLPLAGKTLFEVMFERIRDADVDQWWLATTTDPTDDVTAALGQRLGMNVFRGDVEDVMSRFVAVLKRTDDRYPWLVRITADDPFVDAAVINLLLTQARRVGNDKSVVSEDPAARRLPLGYVPQVARSDRVVSLSEELTAAQRHHRSHVLSRFYETDEVSVFVPPPDWPNHPEWRWTVDTRLDLEMAGRCFELFSQNWRDIGYREMATIIESQLEIMEINQMVIQRAIEEG